MSDTFMIASVDRSTGVWHLAPRPTVFSKLETAAYEAQRLVAQSPRNVYKVLRIEGTAASAGVSWEAVSI